MSFFAVHVVVAAEVGHLHDLVIGTADDVRANKSVVVFGLLFSVGDEDHVQPALFQRFHPVAKLELQRAKALQGQAAGVAVVHFGVTPQDVFGEAVKTGAEGVNDHGLVVFEVGRGDVRDFRPGFHRDVVLAVAATVCARIEVEQQGGVCSKGKRGFANPRLAVNEGNQGADFYRISSGLDVECHVSFRVG